MSTKGQTIYIEIYWEGSPIKGMDKDGDVVPENSCFLLIKKKRIPLKRSKGEKRKSDIVNLTSEEILDYSLTFNGSIGIVFKAQRTEHKDCILVILKISVKRKIMAEFYLPLNLGDSWQKPIRYDIAFKSLRARAWIDRTDIR